LLVACESEANQMLFVDAFSNAVDPAKQDASTDSEVIGLS